MLVPNTGRPARRRSVWPLLRGDRMSALPSRVQTEVQRILDGAARRLLAEQMDGHAVAAAAGGYVDPLDGRADQRPALIDGQAVPVPRGVDGHGRLDAA